MGAGQAETGGSGFVNDVFEGFFEGQELLDEPLRAGRSVESQGDVVVVPDANRDGFFVDVQSDVKLVFFCERNVLEPFLFWG